ncbi:hypothetical protein SAMN02745157_1502 [Kaistia soli DSM 19436]|uniref:Uncharacterized protein n=1 Tax=Kaistia soli DSM 19436 TaxID=1122133 RepID=A0A1M4YEQ9_9HYPH|nr:hypothetical protein [Kaistia soli]SHF04267.1 hypothetical protein SAMN02745157_1502 [Kaistia soli DSM 19436]
MTRQEDSTSASPAKEGACADAATALQSLVELGERLGAILPAYRQAEADMSAVNASRSRFISAMRPAALTALPADRRLFNPGLTPELGRPYSDYAIDRLVSAAVGGRPNLTDEVRKRVEELAFARDGWRRAFTAFELDNGHDVVERGYDAAADEYFGLLDDIATQPAVTLDDFRVKARAWASIAAADDPIRHWADEDGTSTASTILGSLISSLIGEIVAQPEGGAA